MNVRRFVVASLRGHLAACRVPAVALALLALSGCYPSVHKYWRTSVPGAEYRKDTCIGSLSTYYEYHGIFISLSVGDAGYPLLRFYLPRGTVIQVNDNVMHVYGEPATGTTEVTLTLRATLAGLGTSRSRPVRRMLTDNFGPLEGSDEPDVLTWYLFGADAPIPAGVSHGILRLPSLTINGQRYESQSVPFTQETFAGVLPVNC